MRKIKNNCLINFEVIKQGNPEKNDILFGVEDSPYGNVFLAKTPNGICNFQFMLHNKEYYLEKLGKKWANSAIKEDNKKISGIVKKIFIPEFEELKLHLSGTEFQLKVWQTLLNLPEDRLFSYKDVARMAGMPHSIRAAANAVGQNPVHYLVPCHRIIKNDGTLGGYAAGINKKRILLATERLCVY